ncbi:MAG: YceI family protein [Chloroflexota bacterium]|nr:YceI family protein [Chloroflexota bacterium]
MKVRLATVTRVIVLGLVGAIAFAFLRPPPEASGPIQAIALEQPGSATLTRFEIQPAESQARFVIDEVLRGSPKTVVGATNQVAGQIAVDSANPEGAQVGAILVNARTFVTDSTQRDRAIQNFILQTDAHEYIAFQPTDLVDLPPSARMGEAMNLQVVGDLTIRGVTRPVTFKATVTPESADRLQGSAATTIRYADWGITNPEVPAVTGVSDAVGLQIDFVATAA